MNKWKFTSGEHGQLQIEAEGAIIFRLQRYGIDEAAKAVKILNAYESDLALKRELVEQLGIALETVDCLRDGFTEELSGDACVNLDKIMTIWKALLTRAEKTL